MSDFSEMMKLVALFEDCGNLDEEPVILTESTQKNDIIEDLNNLIHKWKSYSALTESVNDIKYVSGYEAGLIKAAEMLDIVIARHARERKIV
jgi:hypothetical protein